MLVNTRRHKILQVTTGSIHLRTNDPEFVLRKCWLNIHLTGAWNEICTGKITARTEVRMKSYSLQKFWFLLQKPLKLPLGYLNQLRNVSRTQQVNLEQQTPKKRFQRKNRQSVYSYYWQILRNLKKINSGLWWCVIKLSHMQIDSYFWRHKPFFQDSYPVSRLKTCPVGKEYRKMRHCCKSQDCRVDIPSSLQKEVKSMHQGDPLCRSWVQSICTWSESGMRRHGAHIMC